MLAGTEAPISTVAIMSKQLRVIGITVGTRRAQLDMIRAVEVNGIKPVIDREFAFEQLPDALTYLEAGRARGKVVLKVR